jgi:hypothetical protein
MAAPRYRLQAPPFLDPHWFNHVRQGPQNAVVDERGVVVVAGEDLRFFDAALPAGTEVQVTLSASGFFQAVSVADLAAEREEFLRAEDMREQSRRMAQNATRAAAEEANAEIRLPVKWDVGIKDVLSGLTESSNGCGRNSRTVEHIILLEPLEFGRLVRDEGDFLCSSSKADNGKRWSGQVAEQWVDGDGNTYQPPVTCKKCLEVAQRVTQAMSEQEAPVAAPKAKGPKL